MPGLYDLLFGTEGKFKQAPSQFTPEQQSVFPQLLQQGLSGLGTGAIEGLARQNFQKSTIPLISTRFANVNAGGTSGYQNALQNAGTNLESQLAALRQGNAMNLLRLGLTPNQGETYFEPGTEGIGGNLLGSAANAGLAALTGGLSSAPFGILSLFKRLFGGGGEQIPQAFTGIQAESSSPLRQRLLGQSPLQSLGQASGINNSLFSGGRFLGEQPIANSQPEAYNQAQQPGTLNAISLLNQAYQAGLPGAARRSDLLAALALPRPGFEL